MRTNTDRAVLIADAAGRLFLSRLGGEAWIRHDRRWRTKREVFDRDTRVFQGVGARALVQRRINDVVECEVIELSDPTCPVATGRFDGEWKFAGLAQAWADVPEYVLIDGQVDEPIGSNDRTQLLRIADGAVVDPLDEIGRVDVVASIPGSRLVVLAGVGRLTVWDPAATENRALAHMSLANGSLHPEIAFRNDSAEMLINNADTLLKLETKQWRPIDAAGSVASGSVKGAARILCWAYRFADDSCFLVREHDPEVLVVGGSDLMPISTVRFPSPPSAIAIRRNSLFCLDSAGSISNKPAKDF